MVPPSAPDIEMAYLGTLLTNEHAAQDSINFLPQGNFYSQKHEIIYETILTIVASGEPVDLITVSDRLRKDGLLDQVGGVYYLSELSSRAVAASSQDHYSKVLIEYGIRRKAYRILMESARAFYDLSTDVFELVGNVQQDLSYVEESSTQHNSTTLLGDAVETAYKHMREVDGVDGGITGIGTGFEGVDELTAGWQKSDLIIIAARPSMGKTAFSLSMIRNAYFKHKVKLAMFSFEMGSRSLAQRMLTSEARVDATRARKGQLTSEEWERVEIAREKLKDIQIYLDDSSDSSISYVASRMRKLVREDGIDGFVIDYLQLMTATAGNREQEIATITRQLKMLAIELDVPIIALSQLSRAVENRGGDKRPQLSDLRESGAIEQDADVVAFIYRAERYGIEVDDNGNSTKGIGEIIISKQRNGPLGLVALAFVEEYARFENLTTYYVPAAYDFEEPNNQQTELRWN